MADHAETWVKDLNGEELTEVEAFQLDRMWMQNFRGFQTSFQQLRRDEIATGANFFRDASITMLSLLVTWEKHRGAFQREFVDYMEQSVFSVRPRE
jgi:hypothetical protein